MTTGECITALFSEFDEPRRAIPKHPEAHLWPREVVTLGRLHALTGGGNRACSRWLTRDYRTLCPLWPERTRLLRLFVPHQAWTQVCLAAPTVLGGIDTDGIALIHPRRAGRRPHQIGRTGLATHRGMVGGTRCLLRKQWGVIVGGACATTNVADTTLPWRMRHGAAQRMVWRDTGCHAAEGEPSQRKVCQRGEWQDRMLVETVRSMLTRVCHLHKVMRRGWMDVQARLACPLAACNGLVQWPGFQPYASGFVPLSRAELSL